jgi:hypothetical protein
LPPGGRVGAQQVLAYFRPEGPHAKRQGGLGHAATCWAGSPTIEERLLLRRQQPGWWWWTRKKNRRSVTIERDSSTCRVWLGLKINVWWSALVGPGQVPSPSKGALDQDNNKTRDTINVLYSK